MMLIPECIEQADGSKEWRLNGQLHRTDGPAIERANGTKYWYLNDQLHRTDGPAVELADGSKEWFLNGHRHRTDGPAVEYAGGTKSWYLNGKRLTLEEVKTFKHLHTCPKKELLEWVGTIFVPIIEHRMKES